MRRYYSYRGENGADWVEADPETAEARMVSRYGGCWLRLEELIHVPGRGPLWDEDDLRKESPLSEEEFHRLWNMASKHERVSVGVSFNWPSFDLRAAQPLWVLRVLPPEYIPQIARNELSQDRGGDAVVRLARMERAEGPEASACFDDAMSELGLPALSPFDALMKASATVAESIAENRTHPYVGVRQLLYLLHSCHTHEWFTIDALFPFVGLDSEAEDHKFRQHFQELLDAIVDEAQVFLLASPG